MVKNIQDIGKGLVGKLITLLQEGPIQHGAAQFYVFITFLKADETADAGPGLAGDDEPFPCRRWGLGLRCDDFDLIAVSEFASQRHHPAVDFGADAAVADFGMDGIGEIHGRCAPGQVDKIAPGGKAEHLVLEHFQLGVLQKLLRFLGVLQNVQKFAQPTVLGTGGVARALLIVPMGGDAVFADVIHFGRANLQFDALAFRAENPGMERAVTVGLGG